MENVISGDKNHKITQTDFDVYSKFPPQAGNNGTEEQLKQFNDLHGKNSSFNLGRTVSKLFNYSKTKLGRSISNIESPTSSAAPLALPESQSSSSLYNKTDADSEMSVRQPLLQQMDFKLDNESNHTEEESLGYKDSFKAANYSDNIEVKAVLHSN